MKRLLILLFFGFGLMGKSFGQINYEMKNFVSVGYMYSSTQRLSAMAGFNIDYSPKVMYSYGGGCNMSGFQKIGFYWLQNQTGIPKNDCQKSVLDFHFWGAAPILDLYKKRSSHIFLGLGLSAGLVKLYKDVTIDSQSNTYSYVLKNKWYVGLPVRFEWAYFTKSWFHTGLYVYGNFHRYKDFGAGVNLYFGKVRAN